MTHTPKWARRLVVPVLVMLQAACATTTWTTAPLKDANQHPRLRVWLAEVEEPVKLWRPAVIGDSVLRGSTKSPPPFVMESFPLEDIRFIESPTKNTNVGQTALLVVGVLVGLSVLYVRMVGSDLGG